MKKFSMYILIIIAMTFLFPTILTSRFNYIETSANNDNNTDEKNNENQQYEYKNYGEITVINSETSESQKMNLDEYLYGVVAAEMPVSYDIEALKAQAVVARTYTIYTITHNSEKHGKNTICTSSSCCQAWISKEDRMEKWEESERTENWSKIEECVNSTQGQVIEYNGEVIDAFFHSNSGGKTEIPVNVWGGTDYPYLQVVETSGEEDYSQFSSEVILSKEELTETMKKIFSDFSIDWNDEKCIDISEYNDSR